MKAFILEKIAQKLSQAHRIVRALRVDENLILLQFDKDRYYFDLTRGKSGIYINIDYPVVRKFSAPFDRLLERRFTRARLIEVKQWERILVIGGENGGNFKREITYLRLEFTGRHTNAILLNREGVVIESLRHITSSHSRRVVVPGVKLEELPRRKIEEKKFPVENLEEWSQREFARREREKLEQLKGTILQRLEKKIGEIKQRLANMESEEELRQEGEKFRKWGEILLANLHKIPPHGKKVELEDWEGNLLSIPIPPLSNRKRVGDYYFKLARRSRNRAKNLHIQRKYLQEQLEFLENYRKLVENTQQIWRLRSYTPPKREEKKGGGIQKMEIDGFQIWIGKNSQGNQQLLREANGEDLWFHIKNYPGPHLLLKSARRKIPERVIREVARLAVQFAGKSEGEVDYTRRKFVKVKGGSQVEYGKYSTIKVKEEPNGTQK
jgi:predicted ribosome quality control (RQC) complex YloA/Tae2 family protein